MDNIELETINFVNKGDDDFDTNKQAINADNLNLMQANIQNSLNSLTGNLGNLSELSYEVISEIEEE